MYNHEPSDYQCPFCSLVDGTTNGNQVTKPEEVIYQNSAITIFMCSRGYHKNPGHVLVISNNHVENLYDLSDEVALEIHKGVKKVALVMKEIYKCDGITVRQNNEPAGNQDVWHYHVHVYPRFTGDELFKTSKQEILLDERLRYAQLLKKYI